jgi:large subunit ribosomal protein L18
MDKAKSKQVRRQRAHQRIRAKVRGTAERPRMSVYKSARYIYAQLIDDENGHTLAQASSREAEIAKKAEGKSATKGAARLVGETVAERAKQGGIAKVVFDRGGYVYHGKVKEVAEGARAKGLEF